MKAAILIVTWFYGQSVSTSQQEFTSMASCQAARSAIAGESDMVHKYLQGGAGNGSGPVFPFASVVCVEK